MTDTDREAAEEGNRIVMMGIVLFVIFVAFTLMIGC